MGRVSAQQGAFFLRLWGFTGRPRGEVGDRKPAPRTREVLTCRQAFQSAHPWDALALLVAGRVHRGSARDVTCSQRQGQDRDTEEWTFVLGALSTMELV